MFDNYRLEKFSRMVEDAVVQSTVYLRQNIILQNIDNYRDLFDYFCSLSFELPINFSISIKYNTYSKFDFQNDFGRFIYFIINKKDKKSIIALLHTFPYYIQFLIYVFTTPLFRNKVTEEFILDTIYKYYKLSDILTTVIIPDTLDKDTLQIQSISRDKVTEDIIFPINIYQIPKKYKYDKLCYYICNNGKVVSNILSGVVRNNIKMHTNLSTYGIIGAIVKSRKYKRKYAFVPIFFSEDIKDTMKVYRNRGQAHNYLHEYSFLYKDIGTFVSAKEVRINNESEFITYLKKYKNNNKSIIIHNRGISSIKTNIKYEYARIIDYIYNEDFNAIGLFILLCNKEYKIYFDVMNSSYVNGIKDRFVKVGINYYNDRIINVFYNSDVKEWSNYSNSCIICHSVAYKHHSMGVCNKCYNNIHDICSSISGIIKQPCDKILKMVVVGVEVVADGKYVTMTPLKGKQLCLPLYETKNICEGINNE